MDVSHVWTPQWLRDDIFLKWYRDIIFAKNQDEKDKALVVFEDAEVPLHPSLLKMILKQNWRGQDVGISAALAHTEEGQSPFTMADLTEDDVAYMQ